ncbi:hypothetical protein OKW35_006843 [Paraburkholderia sp. MM5477-R1]
MDSHELFCWSYLLFPPEVDENAAELLDVDDEIAAWG